MPTQILRNLKTEPRDMPKLQNQYYGGNFEQLCRNLFDVFDKHLYAPVREFLSDIYNLDTANTDGLDLWGKLLDFPRVIKGVDKENGKETVYNLTDDQYRIILKVLALNMKSNLTIPELNAAMHELFKTIDGTDKKTSILDSRDMSSVAYFFEWNIPLWLKAAFEDYELLPHPMGVGVKISSALIRPIGMEGQEAEATNFYRSYWDPEQEKTSKPVGMEGQSSEDSTNWYYGRYPKYDNPQE